MIFSESTRCRENLSSFSRCYFRAYIITIQKILQIRGSLEVPYVPSVNFRTNEGLFQTGHSLTTDHRNHFYFHYVIVAFE